MKKIRNYLIALIIGIGIGLAMRPEPEVKVVEKIVKQQEVKERIKTIESPDGTKTTIVDRNIKEKTKSESKKHSKPTKKDWIVGLTKSLTSEDYRAHVSRRILGDIYITGTLDNKLQVGVGLSISF